MNVFEENKENININKLTSDVEDILKCISYNSEYHPYYRFATILLFT